MNDKTYLTEKQKRELFKLINDNTPKEEVELKYFALTKKTLKLNTYKKHRKINLDEEKENKRKRS